MRYLILIFLVSFLYGCDDKNSSITVEKLSGLRKQLQLAITPLKETRFSSVSVHDIAAVQSPFRSRVITTTEAPSIEELARFRWKRVGEVRKNTELLGVFLESQNKSMYFGKDLPIIHGDWRVLRVTPNYIVFQRANSSARWKLCYTQ